MNVFSLSVIHDDNADGGDNNDYDVGDDNNNTYMLFQAWSSL